MPIAPLVLNKSNPGEEWMWTASTVLGLRGNGLEFDPASPAGGSIEAYVERLLSDSFSRSPTFWHYAARHVPSDSLVCAAGVDHQELNDNRGLHLVFENDLPQAEGIMGQIPDGLIPMHGYAAHALGSLGSVCYCGWDGGAAPGSCVMPPPVCEALRGANATSCGFDAASWPEVAAEAEAAWPSDGSWPCPEVDLSDAWGVAADRDADTWILSQALPRSSRQNVSMDVSELVASGRAGLRIGNAATIAAQARREGVSPASRLRRLHNASLRACASSIMSTFDPESLVDDVVQDLFPMAQAVHESSPISTCLRYSIEYARRVPVPRALIGFIATI